MLIDRDKLLRLAKSERETCGKDYDFYGLLSDIEHAPTVDAVPVKHGRWEQEDNVFDDLTYICSACHEPWTLITGTPLDNNMYYCPNCGAKMDLEEQDADRK